VKATSSETQALFPEDFSNIFSRRKNVGTQDFPVRYTARDAATNPRSRGSKAGETTGAGGMKGEVRLGGSGRRLP